MLFKSNGDAYIYDLGSTHGTFVNKNQVKKRVYVDLHVGDVIRFGHSSRLYIFQGPPDLMPPEADLKNLRNAKMRQDMQDMEASLLRAKVEASHADGISWGMGEDAYEEMEDEVDEITWQTYKGQLTEKQEKTREKVIKRLGKITHMKKEIDAIRAKDIAQGGLTQGQQTQIARNEQRISQIMEELENLEETLNESIRESLGARAGNRSRGKKKGAMEEDEDDYLSDDDEFYDRTKKPAKQKDGESQSVETADSLLDKKDALIKQMEEKEKLLQKDEKPSETKEAADAGDALDAYMSSVSSQLALDHKEKLRNELSTLQSELDRVLYLLKIADPSGEAAKKRESRGQSSEATPNKRPEMIVKRNPASNTDEHPLEAKTQQIIPSAEKSKNLAKEGTTVNNSIQDKTAAEEKLDVNKNPKEPEPAKDESKATAYTISKPQWLGAVDSKKQEVTKEEKKEITKEMLAGAQETDDFVDYKDRGKILSHTESTLEEGGLENAAPGLIIRKRKKVSEPREVKDSEEETMSSGFKAEDAVALLLKHSRGYHEEDTHIHDENHEKKDAKKPKRVLGPEKPSFLEDPDYSSWVPPDGQTGDGRTSLNERLGY
ncbi:uncharacterized protein LOC127258162 isoform X2 [Andrographis paniculata]|uniref:uncharacterized protein LOC127258162 isoform X2 n=1 Tax=Andrographis paniculata TaxID=175694 RepID=UPI0021E8DD2D|nr:uncharacterized protein LOC127258162 isoform X2 [Andrographis paniculata]